MQENMFMGQDGFQWFVGVVGKYFHAFSKNVGYVHTNTYSEKYGLPATEIVT